MAGERERPEDRLEELLSAPNTGETGAPRANETGELSTLRDVAGDMRDARASIPPSKGAGAFAAMMNQLETARMSEETGGFGEVIAGWWKRPVLRTGAAVTAAVLVLGGASLGVAAATGNEPVRNLFGISSNSTIKVELTGTVVSVNGPVVEVSANGDIRVVVIDENTDLTSGGDDDTPLPLDGILVGQVVEVHGRLQPDNSILATRFHLEDGDDGIGGTPTAGAPTQAVPTADATSGVPTVVNPTVGVPTVGSTPSAGPTVDDHGGDRDDDDDDDNSGSGSGDDDGDDDNSGSGSGDDDGDDDNSGSGSGDDDGDDDNSGSGSGDDDGDDDNSGSGSGDDDGDDDNSGSGSGDDDGDDD